MLPCFPRMTLQLSNYLTNRLQNVIPNSHYSSLLAIILKEHIHRHKILYEANGISIPFQQPCANKQVTTTASNEISA